MNRVQTPQSHCRIAIGRCDITPPVGIYHRMWGAALHDQATGVHRPLEATLLWLEAATTANGSPESESVRVIVSLDHCVLDTQEVRNIQRAISAETGVEVDNILVTLSHTHGSGWMSRSRCHLPGGEMIGPYLDGLATRLADLARDTRGRVVPATIVYGLGRCSLAAHRDYLDVQRNGYVCGFNPSGPADDTLLVARVTDENGVGMATIVNYACHPTTLAWENTLISPDWVGAMREAIEGTEAGPCLFLQGASGDLGPREGFVGDTAVSDRNGRQVGYSALSTLATLPTAGTEFRYTGPVVSGATLGTWKHVPADPEDKKNHSNWRWKRLTVDLPYRLDLPTIEQTTVERDQWIVEEDLARTASDEDRLRHCRAQVEQRTRQLTRLNALSPGRSYPLTVHIGIVGDATWIFVPGELYQVFQTSLRQRFASRPVIVVTLTNDWQPGYIPPASTYGYGIYQEIIAATAPGCSEALVEAISRAVERLCRVS